MDNLTHSLVGAVIGQAGLKRLSGLGLPTLIIAANIPDIDAGCTVYGVESLAMRRGITHGPIAMLVLPLLLTGAMLAWDRWQVMRGTRPVERPEVKPLALFLLALVGTLSHPAFDWLNTYGVRLLEPFSHRWFYGDSIFIIDLWMWIGLGLSVWLSRRREKHEQPTWARPAQLGGAAVLIYIAFNIGLSWNVEERATEALSRMGIKNALVVASPPPVRFWQRDIFWRDATSRGSGAYTLLGGLQLSHDRFPLGMDAGPIGPAAAQRADVAAFLFWARMPFAEMKGNEIVLGDQRYSDSLTAGRFTVSIPAHNQ